MNFDDYQEIRNKYLGSDKKKTLIIDGERYMLKFPDPVREKGHDLSYINNAYSEYLGCKIYKSIGIPTQDVILGTYTEENGRIKVSCACKDFCADGYELYEVEGLMLSMTEENSAHRTELSAIMRLIEKQGDVAAEMKDRFYDMFVVDYLINNPDRHNGNWGILSNPLTGKTTLAPVYDCGSCLMPILDETELSEAVAKNSVINMHSAVQLNGKRIFCSEYLNSRENPELNEAVKRLYHRIDIDLIHKIIEDVPYISETRKKYYKASVDYAYDLVLSPVYRELTKDRQTLHESSYSETEKMESREEVQKTINKEADFDF